MPDKVLRDDLVRLGACAEWEIAERLITERMATADVLLCEVNTSKSDRTWLAGFKSGLVDLVKQVELARKQAEEPEMTEEERKQKEEQDAARRRRVYGQYPGR